MLDVAEEDPAELRAGKSGLSYVSLDGNIACLVNGAGLAMSTMDLIKYHGGEPANFLDVGGGASKDQVLEGFRILLDSPNVKAVLVNIFGGIMKCDTIASALLAAYDEIDFRVPLVVRLEGTNVEAGRKLLDESGRKIITAVGPDRRRAEGRRRGQGGGVIELASPMAESQPCHRPAERGIEARWRTRYDARDASRDLDVMRETESQEPSWRSRLVLHGHVRTTSTSTSSSSPPDRRADRLAGFSAIASRIHARRSRPLVRPEQWRCRSRRSSRSMRDTVSLRPDRDEAPSGTARSPAQDLADVIARSDNQYSGHSPELDHTSDPIIRELSSRCIVRNPPPTTWPGEASPRRGSQS